MHPYSERHYEHFVTTFSTLIYEITFCFRVSNIACLAGYTESREIWLNIFPDVEKNCTLNLRFCCRTFSSILCQQVMSALSETSSASRHSGHLFLSKLLQLSKILRVLSPHLILHIFPKVFNSMKMRAHWSTCKNNTFFFLLSEFLVVIFGCYVPMTCNWGYAS